MPWHVKVTGAYNRESTEAQDNAKMIYNVLRGLGWSLPAVSGMLGNVEAESGYNPWRWQSDSVLEYGSSYINVQSGHAYGLCQWDPAGKYINNGGGYTGYGPNYSNLIGSMTDGAAQLAYLNDNADYYPTTNYPLSYAQYKAADIAQYSIDYLARAWFYNFERGTWSANRVTAAEYWYQFLSSQPVGGKIPIWLMFKLKEGGNHG